MQNRKKEARTHSLEVDQYLLNLDKNKVDEHNIIKQERKKIEENEGKNNLMLQEFRNNRNLMEKQKEQKEFNDLNKRNLYKEIQKEANYKNVRKLIKNMNSLFLVLEKHCRKSIQSLSSS